MSCISASESRNASVDSAPWFSLTRSTCSASRQPPVSGEYNSRPRSFQPRNQSNARWACSYHQRVRRGAIGRQTGGHHGLRLDGLLIEVRARAAAPVKTVAADGPEMAVSRTFAIPPASATIAVPAPAPAGWPAASPLTIRACESFGVVIGEDVFKPRPVRLRGLVKQPHQPRDQAFRELRRPAGRRSAGRDMRECRAARTPTPAVR